MEIVLTNADTLEHVFSFLDVSSVCKCNQVCKLWHEVLQDNSKVWYSLCVRHWPWKWDSNYTEQLNNTINWKHIYQHIGSVNNNTFTSSIVVGCATTAVRWILNGKETLTPEQIENLLCFVRRFPTLSFYKETETINDHEEAELAAIDPKLRANVFIPTWWKNLRSVLSFVEPSANYVAVKLTRTEHPCHLGKCGLRLLKHNNIISLGGAATKIAKIYTVFRGEGTVTPDSLQCSADFHLWGIDIMTPEARLKKQMQKAEKEAKAAEKRNARPEAANNNTSDGNNSDDDDSNVLRDLLAALDLAAESDNGSSDTTAPEETSPPKFTIPKNALVPPPPEAIYEWCLGAMTAGKVRVFDSYTKLLANISSITTQNRESVEAMDYITYKGTLVLDVYCTPITEMNQSNRKLLTSSMIKHIQKLTQRVNIDVSCKGDISGVWDIPVNFQHLFGLESPPASTNTNLKLRIVGKVIAGQDVLDQGYAEITQGEPEMSEEEGSLNSSIEIAPPTKSAREPTLNLSINHHATSSFNVSIKNTSTVDLENSDAEDVVLDKDDSLPVPPAAPPGPTLEDIRAQLARADVMKFTGKVNYNISGTLLGGMSLVFQPVTWSLNDNEQNPLAVLEIISGMLRCISGIVENDQNMDNHYLNLSTSTEITNNNNNNAALSVSRFDLINGSKMEKQTLTAINSLVGGNNDPFHILNYLQKELLTKWQPSVIKAVVHTLQENEGGGWESHLQLGHPLLFVAHQRLQCLITHLYNRPNRSSILHNINALLDRELDNYLLLIEHFRKLEINAAKVKLLEPEPPKKETRNRRNTDEEPNREETEESHSYIYYESHNFFDLLHADEAADPRPTIPTRIAFPIALSPLLNNHNNIQSRNLTIVGKALDSPDRYGTVGCTAYLDKLRAIIDNSGYFPMESETDQAISPFLCEMLRYYTNLLFRTGVYNYNCALGILLYGGVQTETSVHLIGQLVAAAQSLKAAQGFSKSRTVFNNLVGELLLEYAGASENMAEESDDNSNNNNNNNNSRTIRNMKHKDSKLKQYCVEQVVQNFATWAHCVFKHLTFTNLSMTFIDINCLIILEKIGDSPEVISKLPLIVINKCITHLRLSKWYAYNMYERIDKLLDKYTQLHSQIKETTHEIPIESEREEFLLSPSVKSSELNDYYEQRWTLTRSALHEASQNPPNAHATTAALAAAIAATTSNMAATGGPGITTAAIPVAPGLLQHLANTNWIFPDWLRFEDLPKLYWVSDDQPLSRGAQRWLLYHILHLHKGDPGTPMLLDHLGGIDAQRLQELVSVISLIRKPELHKLAERVTNQFLTDHSFGSNIQQNLTALYIDNKSQMSVMDTLALIGDEFTVEYYIRKEINQIQQILTRLLSPSPPPTNNQLRNQLQMLQKAQHMQLRTQLRVLMDCIKQLLKNHHSYTSYYWFSRLCDFTLEVGARPYSNVWQMREAAKKGFTGFHDFCDMLISNHLRNLVSQLTEQKNSYSYHTTSTELTERIEEDITFLFNRLKTAMTSERIFTWKQLRENFFETFRVAEKVSPRARDFDAILFQLVDPTSDNSVLFQYCMDSFQGFDLEDHPVKFSDDSLFKVAHPLSLYFLAERLNIKPPQAEPTVAVQPEAQQTSSASNETVAFQDKDEEVPQPATVTEATELILPNALVINPLIQHWEKKLTHLGQTAQPFDQLYRPVYLERIPFAKLFEGYKFSSTDALEDILSRRGYLSLHVEGSNNNQQISKRIKCLGDDFFVVISYVLTRGKARPTHLVEFELAIIPTRSEEFKLKEEHFIPAESVSDVFYSEALSELVGVLKKQGPPTTQLTLYQQMNLPVNWEYEFMEF